LEEDGELGGKSANPALVIESSRACNQTVM
jgi:hypothetical protein